MEFEHYTDNLIYQMEQTTLYCKEKGEQYFKSINLGLTIDQFAAMDILSINSGICQMDLAKLILKDRVYTSRVLNVLEEKGLIERRVETKGKRLVNKLYLTSEGKNLLKELQQELSEIYEDVLTDMTKEELETLKDGIRKFKECISKYIIMPL